MPVGLRARAFRMLEVGPGLDEAQPERLLLRAKRLDPRTLACTDPQALKRCPHCNHAYYRSYCIMGP